MLTLKFVFDFSNAEVGTILGKSEGAVKSLQHRALASLQRQLGPSADGGRGRNRRPAERGKTTLFNVLTQAGAEWSGKEHVGMAPIADDRLPSSPKSSKAKKVTPAAIRVVDVPGTGAQLLGNLRQVDALLAVLDDWSGTRDPEDDLETLSSSSSSPTAITSSAASSGAEAGEVGDPGPAGRGRRAGARPRSPGGGTVASEYERASARARAADDEADRRDPERSFRGRREARGGARGAVRRRRRPSSGMGLRRSRTWRAGSSRRGPADVLHGGEKETARWTLQRGRSALDAAASIHSDIAQGFIRAEVIRWDDLVEAGSHAEAAKRGLQRLEGKTYVVEDGDVLNVRFNL